MNFASQVRDELARSPMEQAAAARSELTAALLSSGGISFRGNQHYALSLTVTEGVTARRYYSAFKQLWSVSAEIRTLQGAALAEGTRYRLIVPENASLRILGDLHLLDPQALFGIRQLPEEGLLRGDEARRGFLRGAFLVCGSVSNPEREWHLEFGLPGKEFADLVARLAEYYDLHARAVARRTKHVVYLKRAADICDMLTLLGAPASVLHVENVRIQKDMRNHINRQMNCDSSNIERTVKASQTTIREIDYLREEVGLEKLPAPLREIAMLRTANPDASLAELGDMLDPPLGKSGVRSRLRKLTELAEKLRGGEDTGLGE